MTRARLGLFISLRGCEEHNNNDLKKKKKAKGGQAAWINPAGSGSPGLRRGGALSPERKNAVGRQPAQALQVSGLLVEALPGEQ